MNAVADYAAAMRALNHDLPAYVSYAVHSHILAGPVNHDETVTIVVRSRDGKIVKGKPPSMQIDSDSKYEGDVVVHPPFDAACYTATAAREATFEGVTAEALSLRDTCKTKHDLDGDFSTLYVDPASHEPLAAAGGEDSDSVSVHVQQRFGRAGAFLLPAAFDVRVKGSGFMFWLDVTGRQTYDSYKFSDTLPS
jgi:hypothetical protein